MFKWMLFFIAFRHVKGWSIRFLMFNYVVEIRLEGKLCCL